MSKNNIMKFSFSKGMSSIFSIYFNEKNFKFEKNENKFIALKYPKTKLEGTKIRFKSITVI